MDAHHADRDNQEPLDELLPLIYSELRAVAANCLRHERVDHTLRATALVHEAYLKLAGSLEPRLQTRAHFVGIAARAMRQILVDHDRARRTRKRGGEAKKISLELVGPIELPGSSKQVDLLALDDVLRALESIDAQQAQIIELRFFGGLSLDETAQVLGVSTATVKRDWAMARAWLFRKLSADGECP